MKHTDIIKRLLICWITIILGVIVVASCVGCKKVPADTNYTVQFTFKQNHSKKMSCSYVGGIDTVYTNTYTITQNKVAEKSLYDHKSIPFSCNGKLISNSPLDSIQVFIYINGSLSSQGIKTGQSDYYYSKADASYSW